uniref:Uncharacterized protein n=1 Tax=Triticum urartu TaxID=4572 RepID=A0A8R7V7M5_TRIUA
TVTSSQPPPNVPSAPGFVPLNRSDQSAATRRERGLHFPRPTTGGDGGPGGGAGRVRARAPRNVPGGHVVRAPQRLRHVGGQPPHPRLLRRRRPLPPPGARPGK